MNVEPTRTEGMPPEDSFAPEETRADATLRLPEEGEAAPTEAVRVDQPTQTLPSGGSVTDAAPPTVESFVRSQDPAETVVHQPGDTRDTQKTANLPTDEDWGSNAQGKTGEHGATYRGSGASYDTVEASGQFHEGQLIFNRYIVQKEVGRGGMGAVWLVKHRELNVDRALKVIVARISYDSQARVRFRREAQLMASFHHPNAVVVHDARLTESDVAYIDMEYVQGRSLAEILVKGEPMPLEWIARIMDQLCDVLQVAHKNRIVHRDLKPANLMLLDGYEPGREQLKVLDFGIAKILRDAEDTAAGPKTLTGVFLGTPFYASPEQADGRADTRSDIYAVGVILYEFLTGFRPFHGPAARVLVDVMTKPPPTFAEVNPDVHYPAEVEALVMRCLAKQPDDRPQTAREVADLFRAAALPHSSIERTEKPDWEPSAPVPWLARHVKSIVAACALAVAAAAVGWSLRVKPTVESSTNTKTATPTTEGTLVPAGFASAPKADLDEHGRPLVMVKTGEAEPLGMHFVLLPGKTFAMGLPPLTHSETVGDFAISDTEVTNGQMRAYFEMKSITPPEGFVTAIKKLSKFIKDPVEIDNHPAVGVPRETMVEFAHWLGGDLPTAAEWEYAARSGGKDDRYYVWPDTIPPKVPLTSESRFTNIGAPEAGDTTTTLVKNYLKDRTDQGVFDMMGNVREWCRDAGDKPGTFVVRGGSWNSFVDKYSNFGQQVLDAKEVIDDLGFRVVVELPPLPDTSKSP